ncbi:hypothetical protein A2U01_0004255 [Trifolium medium]|uniref:Uncharacterized protein n=1 Tax=Trifolium medium TaxID=97028 RepID=A0A392M8J7_9FABA|nr:hypothetical protein [Trifolium medium]
MCILSIDPSVQDFSLMTRTTYVEFNPSKSRAKLPDLFSRDYGQFLRGYVILQDPKNNQIQVSIEKNKDEIYFTRGWSRLRHFYGLIYGGWVTILYNSPVTIHIEVRSLTGHQVAYPHSDPPRRLMLIDQIGEDASNGLVPHFVAPTSFYHVLEKTLNTSDLESGVLKLFWSGFCENALPHKDTGITLMDWMGFTWKCHLQLQDNSCILYGEWKAMCEARNLTEGSVVKFGVTKPSNNILVHVKVSHFLGVRTTLVAPKTAGGYKAFYQVDHYYML